MTKAQVNKALTEAFAEYNYEMENYIVSSVDSEELKADYRKIFTMTMDCFADFQKVIAALVED